MINVRDQTLITAFGERVRELRKRKEYTIEQLAAKAGIDARQLSNIELGKTNVTISSINILAKALGISLAILLDINDY